MADISFDGIQIDAETVRAKLAEHDRKEASLVGRRFSSPHTASQAEVTEDDQAIKGRSIKLQTGGSCPWYRANDLRYLADWLRELASDIDD